MATKKKRPTARDNNSAEDLLALADRKRDRIELAKKKGKK